MSVLILSILAIIDITYRYWMPFIIITFPLSLTRLSIFIILMIIIAFTLLIHYIEILIATFSDSIIITNIDIDIIILLTLHFRYYYAPHWHYWQILFFIISPLFFHCFIIIYAIIFAIIVIITLLTLFIIAIVIRHHYFRHIFFIDYFAITLYSLADSFSHCLLRHYHWLFSITLLPPFSPLLFYFIAYYWLLLTLIISPLRWYAIIIIFADDAIFIVAITPLHYCHTLLIFMPLFIFFSPYFSPLFRWFHFRATLLRRFSPLLLIIWPFAIALRFQMTLFLIISLLRWYFIIDYSADIFTYFISLRYDFRLHYYYIDYDNDIILATDDRLFWYFIIAIELILIIFAIFQPFDMPLLDTIYIITPIELLLHYLIILLNIYFCQPLSLLLHHFYRNDEPSLSFLHVDSDIDTIFISLSLIYTEYTFISQSSFAISLLFIFITLKAQIVMAFSLMIIFSLRYFHSQSFYCIRHLYWIAISFEYRHLYASLHCHSLYFTAIEYAE